MSIEFTEPDEDYEFTPADIESLLAADNIRSLVGLRDVLNRIGANPANLPYDISGYRAAAIIDSVIQTGDTEDFERLPTELENLAIAIHNERVDDPAESITLWRD